MWSPAGQASDFSIRLARAAHGGPSRARNRGVELARQPWIAFLDADDTWEPDKLLLQWEAVCAQPDDVALVTTDWLRPGQPRIPHAGRPPRVYRDGVARLLWLNRFQTSTVLARRSTILEAGGFDPELDGVEDWDLWLRLSARGRWLHLPLPLVRYADSAGGVSKDLERVYRAGLSMLDRYRREGEPRIRRRITQRVLAWHHLRFAVAFSRVGDDELARGCLRAAWQPGRRWPAAWVAGTALLPFLLGRLQRRLAPLWRAGL